MTGIYLGLYLHLDISLGGKGPWLCREEGLSENSFDSGPAGLLVGCLGRKWLARCLGWEGAWCTPVGGWGLQGLG